MQIANPFVDYPTLAAAEKAAGFKLTAPETVEGYSSKVIQVMDGKMIQIIFFDDNNDRLFVRKEAGKGDISGDYNDYTDAKPVDINGNSVTLKGDTKTVSTAIWTNDGYAYAVSADVPMDKAAMTALVAEIR